MSILASQEGQGSLDSAVRHFKGQGFDPLTAFATAAVLAVVTALITGYFYWGGHYVTVPFPLHGRRKEVEELGASLTSSNTEFENFPDIMKALLTAVLPLSKSQRKEVFESVEGFSVEQIKTTYEALPFPTTPTLGLRWLEASRWTHPAPRAYKRSWKELAQDFAKTKAKDLGGSATAMTAGVKPQTQKTPAPASAGAPSNAQGKP